MSSAAGEAQEVSVIATDLLLPWQKRRTQGASQRCARCGCRFAVITSYEAIATMKWFCPHCGK